MIKLVATSIFDWNGPEFLLFYAVAFMVALIWSLLRRFRANDRFTLPGAEDAKLSDPYEIAYLAGGVPRCCQVALVRLIKSGSVKWEQKGFFKESKLVSVGSAEPGYNDIERALFSAIHSYGSKGMPLNEVPQLVATRTSGVESKLAKLGLRPTESERRGRGFSISLPLIILFLVGVAKVVIGVSRDKPVVFLAIFLFVTVVAAFAAAAGTKKITPGGQRWLDKMRGSDRPTDPQSDDPLHPALCGVALLGISGVAYDEALAGLDANLQKEISQMGSATSSSGCGSGCSSGCSSGCGGGGCGGCGGD